MEGLCACVLACISLGKLDHTASLRDVGKVKRDLECCVALCIIGTQWARTRLTSA
jgi:hypothetical protein